MSTLSGDELLALTLTTAICVIASATVLAGYLGLCLRAAVARIRDK